MEIKLFEVRDRGTCIPVCALKPSSQLAAEQWLLSRAGYGRTSQTQHMYLLLFALDGKGQQITYDPFAWQGSRTMREAHLYLQAHFDSLTSGDVIDVECVLGERPEPKRSERLGSGENPLQEGGS